MFDLSAHDIHVGEATVPAVTQRVWALPGGRMTTNRLEAEVIASRIDRMIRRAGGLGRGSVK
jgi:hypothetical protein